MLWPTLTIRLHYCPSFFLFFVFFVFFLATLFYRTLLGNAVGAPVRSVGAAALPHPAVGLSPAGTSSLLFLTLLPFLASHYSLHNTSSPSPRRRRYDDPYEGRDLRRFNDSEAASEDKGGRYDEPPPSRDRRFEESSSYRH